VQATRNAGIRLAAVSGTRSLAPRLTAAQRAPLRLNHSCRSLRRPPRNFAWLRTVARASNSLSRARGPRCPRGPLRRRSGLPGAALNWAIGALVAVTSLQNARANSRRSVEVVGAEPVRSATLRGPRLRARLSSNLIQDLFPRRESLHRAYRTANSQVTSTRLVRHLPLKCHSIERGTRFHIRKSAHNLEPPYGIEP
jgi:hypothetical protein